MAVPYQPYGGKTATQPSFNESYDPNKWDSTISTKFAKEVRDSKDVEGCDPREVSVSNRLFEACLTRDNLETKLAEVDSSLKKAQQSHTADQGMSNTNDSVGGTVSSVTLPSELNALSHTFRELDKVADDLTDTLYEECLTGYTNTLLKDLSHKRYASTVDAYPGLRLIEGLQEAISDTYSKNRSVYEKYLTDFLLPMMKYEHNIYQSKLPLSVILKENTLDLRLTRGRRNEYSRVKIRPSDRDRYEGIEPVKIKVKDEPILNDSVVQSLVEKGFDSRGWIVGEADVSSDG